MKNTVRQLIESVPRKTEVMLSIISSSARNLFFEQVVLHKKLFELEAGDMVRFWVKSPLTQDIMHYETEEFSSSRTAMFVRHENFSCFQLASELVSSCARNDAQHHLGSTRLSGLFCHRLRDTNSVFEVLTRQRRF